MKQLYVNLAFKADTKAAEANLQKLRTTLSDISAMPYTGGAKISEGIKQASVSAQELQRHLAAAMNVKTGNLDLSKFQASLIRSNQSLQGLTTNLLKAGTTGEQAFLSLHSAIAQSNIQINTSTTLMSRFMVTLKNTARWQLSSTLLTVVISTLTNAISYAKELDKSLNNIRIVTGFSTDEMSKFADQANKAAKVLATTTTAYTDAALIYYQQGLRGDAVLERANTTVKLANIVGKTATEVSEWMTAIWNNFDDGSKSLEYYADAITALGAATASSSEEIATGLEKFAAVAETVGLSYEYATAALATVTSQTRQSADVVGTAFKTLFARMQDLKLGETLDDGTTLGQYSEAMYKVGVNIKTSSGELKDMNLILDELGAKWKELDADQQVALAKSVAGLRQYNQFIALMGNYDYMKQNVQIAEESEGTLQRQAEIYEQSWEGAKKHVQASYEGLVNELFPTDAVIDFTNGLSKVLDAITDIVDMFGGLKGIILLIGTLMVNKFQPQIANAIDSGIQRMTTFGNKMKETYNTAKGTSTGVTGFMKGAAGSAVSAVKNRWDNSDIKNTLSTGKTYFSNTKNSDQLGNLQRQQQTRTENQLMQRTSSQQEIRNSLNSAITPQSSSYFTQMIDTYKQVDDYSVKIANLKGKITEQEREQLSLQMEGIKAVGEELAKEKEKSTELQRQREMAQANAKVNFNLSHAALDKKTGEVTSYTKVDPVADSETAGPGKSISYFKEAGFAAGATGAENGYLTYKNIGAAQSGAAVSLDNYTQISAVQNQIADAVARAKNDEADINKELDAILEDKNNEKVLTQGIKDALREAAAIEGDITKKGAALNKVAAGAAQGYRQVAKVSGHTKTALDEAQKTGKQIFQNTNKLKTAQAKYNMETNNMNKNLQSITQRVQGIGTSLTKGFSAASQMAMGFNMVTNAIKDMSEGEVSLANISTLLMGVPMIITGISSAFSILNNILTANINKLILYNAAKKISNKQNADDIKQTAANIIAKGAEKGLTEEAIKAELEKMFAKKAGMKTDEASAAATSVLAVSKGADTTATDLNTASIWANTAALLASPIFWIAVVILAVGAAVWALTAALGDNSEEQNEVNKSIAENAKKNVDAINSTRELAKSVVDLTEEYIRLKENGESTAEVLKNITEQMPDLIDSYKELQGTLGMDLGAEELEAMYEGFKKGVVSMDELLEKQKEIDDKALKANIDESKRGLTAATSTMAYELDNEGSGSTSGNTYTSSWGGYGDESNVTDIIKEEMGNFVTSSDENDIDISLDTSNSKEVMDYYEKMLAAKARLEKELTSEELADSGVYEELKEDIESMAESYEKAKELADEYFVSVKEGFDADYGKTLSEEFKITSLEQYESEEGRAKIIEKLKEKYKDLTDTQIEGLLSSSEYFKQYEQQMALFEEGSDFRTQIDNNFALTLEDVKKWYDEIPEEDRTLFVGLDFTTIGSKEQMLEEMEKLREEAARTEILNEVTELEVDENEFKMYSQLISKHSEKLSENKVLADQTALAHYKLNKGLSALSDGWEDNLKILKKSTSATPEYAKALGEVSKALEDAFGVPVSSDFITKNLEKIGKVAEGDTSALQGLQDKLAEDYVANMVIGEVSVNDNAAVAVDIARETLQNMLNDLDTSIEIGEEATISDDYLNTLQQMLDAGQITEEQLQNMMRAKGFEFVITDWKEVDGPEKTIKRSSYNEDTGETETFTITEQEQMQVPIINGEGDAIKGTASKPQVVRTVNKSAVNYTNTNKEEATNQAKENAELIEDLKEEKDRYADINEELDDMSTKLERVRKAKDRAFGKDKIKAMREERSVLEYEVKLLEDKSERLEEDKVRRYNDISKYGYAFNAETGAIVNSNEVYDNMLKKYKAGLAAAGNDEDARQKWEDWWNDFTEDTEKYTETVNEAESVTEELINKREELLDLDYEEFEYKIEIKIQVSDWNLKTLERHLKNIEDDAFAAAEAIALMNKQASQYEKQFNINKTAIEDLLKYKGATDAQIQAFMSGDANVISNLKLEDKDFELLDEYREGMEEALSSMEDIFDSMFEKMNEVFDAINEKVDQVNEKLEHAKTIVTSINDLIDLIGSTNLGISKQLVMDITDSALGLAQTQVAVATAQKDKNQQMLQEAREGLVAASTEAEKEKWQDSIDYYEEQVRESEQNWLDSLSSALELGANRRKKAVEQALEVFLMETMGYKTIDDLTQARDYKNQNANLYVKQYEKAYQLSKLTRDINNKINDIDNISAKQKLLNLEEKINKAKEAGVEMSSYELANLQREYDIELAKIALEEAQNAKSQVRLTRNAEGGMSYVYTADENKTSEAAQKLEDTIYNATKANDEWIRSIEDGMLNATQTFIEQLQTINTTTYNSEAERVAAIDELNAWYQGQMDYYGMQMGLTLDNNESLYKNYITTMNTDYGIMDSYNSTNLSSFQKMYTEMYNSGEDFITKFEDTTLPKVEGSLLGESNSLKSFVISLKNELGEVSYNGKTGKPSGTGLYYDLADAQYSWQDFVITSFDKAGLSINTFNQNAATLNGETDSAKSALNEFKDWVKLYIGEGTTDNLGVKKIIEDANSEIDKLQKNTDFTEARDNAVDYGGQVARAMSDANIQLNNVNGALQELIAKWDSIEQLNDIEKEINIKINYTTNDVSGPDITSNNPAAQSYSYSGDSGLDAERKKWNNKYISFEGNDKSIDWNTYAYNGSNFGQIKDVAINDKTGEYEYTFDDPGVPNRKYYTAAQLNMKDKKAGILITDKSGVQTDQGDFAMKNNKGTFNDYIQSDDGSTYYQLSSADDRYTNWNRINENEGIFYADESNTWADMQVYKSGEYIDYGENANGDKYIYLKKKKKCMKVNKNNIGGFMYDAVNKQIAWHHPKEAEVKILSFNEVLAGKDGVYFAKNQTKDPYFPIYKDGKLVQLIKQGGYNYIMMPNIGDYSYNSKENEAVWGNPKDALFKLSVKDGWKYNYILYKDMFGPFGDYEDYDTFYNMFRTSDNQGFEFEVNGGNKTITIDSLIKNKDQTEIKIEDGLYFKKQFDTGGYTGEWGPDGRWALLHQKEIVLNAHDTENLLSIVNMVRQMASSLDLNALAMTSSLANLIATTNVVSSGQQLDQNVTITAEFPNATNKEEIQAAFGDLVNLAAQYANRK